ncbi:Fe-S-containing protein [Consotaella aegiceratis]|uniref:Fe-S-containing protein n=1 Tax=Consotaella aegiceratis TaxID=3097961 RepID=UPI002F40BC88
MGFYIASLAHALLPLAVLIGLLPTAVRGPREDARLRGLGPAVAAGFLAGLGAALLAAVQASEIVVATAIHGVALAACILALLVLVCALILRSGLAAPAGRVFFAGGALLVIAVYAARGLYDAWALSADRSLTVTSVVNTELIVNCAAIVLGAALLFALAVVAGRIAALAGRFSTVLALAIVLVLELVAGSASVMLGLLRLDAIGVTSGRISYVAKISLFEPWVVYVELGVVLLLGVVAFARRHRVPALEDGAKAQARVEHRRQLARSQRQRRWRTRLAGIAVFLFAALAYQDLYASLPPRLSEAAPVEPDTQGEVRIPIDEVKDGDLHRFAYIAGDGHRVRFFLINRYDQQHVHIGVVFDACMICGDDGYVQRGPEIICIACNVRIFKPSIGKPGGCNPIPLNHTVEDDTIVITQADLEKGANYFSEVVEVEATDPVNGDTVINLRAPYRYDYGGRTYFFSGEKSYEEFKADPEKYVGDVQARRWRVQGHEEQGS